MELTLQEKQLTLQMLRQINFPEAITKMVAGQFQLKIEASLSASAPSQVEHQQTPSEPTSQQQKDGE